MVKKIDSVSKWKKAAKSNHPKAALKVADLKSASKSKIRKIDSAADCAARIRIRNMVLNKSTANSSISRNAAAITKAISNTRNRARIAVKGIDLTAYANVRNRALSVIKADCGAKVRNTVRGILFLIEKQSIEINIASKAQEKFSEIFSKQKLSATRQKTLIKNAILNPDRLIKSETKTKNTVKQTITYNYQNTILIMDITISNGAVTINDIRSKLKTAK